MSSLQHRIAILTSLAAQLRELEGLRERVRKAEFSKRPAGRSLRIDYSDAGRKPVPATPAAPWLFSSAAQPTSGSPRRESLPRRRLGR